MNKLMDIKTSCFGIDLGNGSDLFTSIQFDMLREFDKRGDEADGPALRVGIMKATTLIVGRYKLEQAKKVRSYVSFYVLNSDLDRFKRYAEESGFEIFHIYE